MSTLTAMKPRPYVINREVAEVDLIPALPEDLKEFKGYDENGNQIIKLRHNLIYWLKSSLTGKIEGTPRILTENSNLDDLKTWLDLKMIYISESPFALD